MQPRVIVRPPSDGTYTVEVGRELEVTCEVDPDLRGMRQEDSLSVIAFRVQEDGEPEPSGTYVPIILLISPTHPFWNYS